MHIDQNTPDYIIFIAACAKMAFNFSPIIIIMIAYAIWEHRHESKQARDKRD